MKIKPILDRVVLLPKISEEKKGGILIPSVAQEKSQVATVMAVGDGMTADGKEVKILIKEGDTVLFSKYAGVEVESDGKTYVIVRQADILAVID